MGAALGKPAARANQPLNCRNFMAMLVASEGLQK